MVIDLKKLEKENISLKKKLNRKKSKGSSKKILKRPTAKGIEPISTKKLLKGLTQDRALVSEGRTGYFKEEYVGERKWLS